MVLPNCSIECFRYLLWTFMQAKKARVNGLLALKAPLITLEFACVSNVRIAFIGLKSAIEIERPLHLLT